jgi:hypothetical protein
MLKFLVRVLYKCESDSNNFNDHTLRIFRSCFCSAYTSSRVSSGL